MQGLSLARQSFIDVAIQTCRRNCLLRSDELETIFRK